MRRDPKPVCCGTAMERGFIVDHGHGTAYPAAWTAGIARWSRWRGLQVKKAAKVPVVTFRCTVCGRLESYAPQGQWPA